MAFLNFLAKRKAIQADNSNQRRLKLNEPETAALGSDLFCPQCRAVYYKKAWHHNPKKLARIAENQDAAKQCPACQRVANNTPFGIVTLRNIPDAEQRQMLINTIENIGQRAYARDPQERIMKIDDQGETLEIYTTENQLAASLGRQIKKAFGGKLEMNFTPQRHHDSIARVVWEYENK